MTTPMPRTRSVVIWVVFLFAAVCSGCLPGVAWLPDSSGFVYSAGQDYQQIVLYDVAQRRQRVLVDECGAKTYWPAIGPDGKRIAVANLVREPAVPEKMQVIIYDIQGKELERSPSFAWQEAHPDTKEKELLETSLFWAPRGDKLIVHDYANKSKGRTAIYDLTTKRVVLMDGVPAVYESTPIRPDGKGFLLSREKSERVLQLVWVDWQGKENVITTSPSAYDDDDKRFSLTHPFLATSRWDKNNAVVGFTTWRIRTDTDRLIASLEQVPPGEAMVDGRPIQQQFVFSETGAKVRALRFEEKDEKGEKKTHYQLELLKPGAAKPQIIQGRAHFSVLIPAPNRRLAALRYWFKEGEQEKEVILVVNEKGDEVAKITVSQ